MSSSTLASDSTLWDLFSFGSDGVGRGLDAYLQRVTEVCSGWFEADGVSLFLRIEDSDRFALAAQAGTDGELPSSASFALGEGIAGAAAAEGEPLLVDDEAGGRPTQTRSRRRPNVAYAVVAPLLTPEGACVGVLNLSRKSGTSPYTRHDLRRAAALGRHVALAVANARLLARLHATAEQYQALASQTASLVNSLRAGVISLDVSRRVIAINTQAAHLLRNPSDNAAGLEWESLVKRFPKPLRAAIEGCAEAAAGGKFAQESATGHDGRRFAISAHPGPDGGTVLVIEDVTSRAERDRELERARRLAEIGQMTAALAHEIRNPLTGIHGAAQMIQCETEIAEAHKWAKVVEEEATEMNDLLSQFLDLARPTSLDLQDADLNEAVARILRQQEPVFRKCGVRVCFKPARGTPIIRLDPVRLGQAVRNLIRNAVQAMPEGGDLTVSMKVGKGVAVVSIADTGAGIPEHLHERLFAPFYTTKPDGVGLGLCNVRRIVEAHDGRVRLKSKPGKGSTFTIELPVRGKI
ncbi:MAG: GAF domain-containing protein [Armatimonadetes bacterium]|nr:GAF domain-containing protein [Armatimonadota bacterium]